MKINGYRCDNCAQEHLFNPLIGLSSNNAPFGWFTVKASMLLTGPTWMFCSKSCLRQWAEKSQSDQNVATKEVSQ